MSANNIHISHLGTYVLTKRTYEACLTTHLTTDGDFGTSELGAINR